MDKRAIVYARVSGNDRAKTGGANLDSQLEMGREYCKERGYVIIAEMPEDDRGASGAIWDLPQLSQALAMARNKEFDVLVVRELDRFARSLAKQLVIETEFTLAGVEIEYILAQYEDSPEGQLTKHVRAVIAEYERVKIKERMVRGRLNKVKAGQVLGAGNMAYGYRLAEVDGKNTFTVYEPEAQIVKMIFDLYTGAERISIRAITKTLQDMRVSCGERRSGPKRQDPYFWPTNTVNWMLSNETYAGIWHYAGVSVTVPAIIDQEQFEIAQERKQENKATAKRNRKNQYILSGRVKCGVCGTKMIGITCNHKGEVYRYYYCRVRNDHVGYHYTCSNSKRYRADVIEPLVWTEVKAWLSNPQRVREQAEAFKAEKDAENYPVLARLAIVNENLIKTRSRQDNLIDMRADGEISKEQFKERNAQCERIIAELETEKAGIEAEIKKTSITDEQINDLVLFCEDVGRGIESGNDDPEVQLRAYNAIHLTVTLTIENNERVAYLYCILGEKRLSVVNNATCLIAESSKCCTTRSAN